MKVAIGRLLAVRPRSDYPRDMWRVWLVRLLPFLGRWVDAAPAACCGVCPTCLTATASGLTDVPNTLSGVKVLINSNYAGVLYVSATQINLLVPNSLLPDTYSLTVWRDSLGSETVPVVVQEAAPGLFPSAFHVDGTAVSPDAPAISGEVVMFYGTGFGRMLPDPVGLEITRSAASIVHAGDFSLLLDGVGVDPAMVQYVGAAPGNAGLYQINLRIPDGLPNGGHEVRVSVAGVLSPVGLQLITGSPSTD